MLVDKIQENQVMIQHIGTRAGSYINPNDTGSNIVNNARAK